MHSIFMVPDVREGVGSPLGPGFPKWKTRYLEKDVVKDRVVASRRALGVCNCESYREITSLLHNPPKRVGRLLGV